MKRLLKVFIFAVLLCFVISPQALCVESNIDEYSEEFDFQSVFDSLSNETVAILEEIGITEISYESVFAIEPQRIFDSLFNIITNAVENPLKFTVVAIGILMLTEVFASMAGNSEGISLIGGGVLSLALTVPVANLTSNAFSVLEALLVFTTSFAGVFCAIVSSSGNLTMGISYASLTVFSNTVFSSALVNFCQPVITAMCSVGFLSCFDIYKFTERFSSIIKKIYVFLLSFIGTVFSGLVTLKGVLSEGVDSISSRSIRFVIGQSLPVVGGAVSETYSTLISSLSLIKNTVGAFGIITVVIFVLPTLLEVLMWILSLEITLIASQSFGADSVSGVIGVLKDALVLLVATTVILTTIFIVSVGVCIAIKGGAV